ncbi:hypothetical protein GEMRC1_005517 [Eukaryota sp. GEM-RC1]
MTDLKIYLRDSGTSTGMRIELREPSDLEFLNYSSLFPRTKQLEVEVPRQRTSFFMLSIETLKINSTITSLGLFSNSIGFGGVSALADAMKVNTRLKIEGVEGLNKS